MLHQKNKHLTFFFQIILCSIYAVNFSEAAKKQDNEKDASFYNDKLKIEQIRTLPIPPVVMDLSSNSKYKDAKHSIVDPELNAEHEKSVRPINIFLAPIAKMSSAYNREPEKRKIEGEKTVQWLTEWSKQNAMTGVMQTKQAQYERKWFLATVCLIYIKVQSLADTASDKIIKQWLEKLSTLVYENSGQLKNNHYYWEGLALLAAGKILKNSQYIDFGKSVFAAAESDITSDGFLPKELQRGAKAFHYHIFAAAPLVIMESLLELDSPKLKILINKILKNIDDPTEFQTQTKLKQDPVGKNNLAFLVVYIKTKKNEAVETYVKLNQPFFNLRLGGDFRL